MWNEARLVETTNEYNRESLGKEWKRIEDSLEGIWERSKWISIERMEWNKLERQF